MRKNFLKELVFYDALKDKQDFIYVEKWGSVLHGEERACFAWSMRSMKGN